MAKISNAVVAEFSSMADMFLAQHNLTRHDVKTGRDAWSVSHRCGITNAAYKDRDVIDAHIQTALEKIFPHAVFKDKKVY
jgi:hypothetical protein